MKTARIVTAAAGLALTAGLIAGLATPSAASTPAAAQHKIKATLAITPGPLRYTATASRLEVVDATGSGRGWHVVMSGDVQVTSVQCAPHSTCILPSPGVVGNTITADPGTGMGSVIFNWSVSGSIAVNLLSGP
jgi:hypothetical protein